MANQLLAARSEGRVGANCVTNFILTMLNSDLNRIDRSITRESCAATFSTGANKGPPTVNAIQNNTMS